MALLLKTIYRETKEKYKLRLLCGKKGLNRMMNWVYITEDIASSSFVQGGELIITTGIRCTQSKDWLYKFIQSLIELKTCGVILNIGTYVFPEDVTEDIQKLCNKHNFPVFTMPWEIMLHNVTRDYYNRIFEESQTEITLTSAFFNLIFQSKEANYSQAILEEYGYQNTKQYTICQLAATPEVPSDRLSHILKVFIPNSFLCHTKDASLIITYQTTADILSLEMQKFLAQLALYFPDNQFTVGIGSLADLCGLPASYFHAKAAVQMAIYHKTCLFCYEDMGFLKILLSCNEPNILENYVAEKLNGLLQQNHKQEQEYLETLYQYLICDGSIKRIADALFCHRNTINYRIRILKEDMGFNLDDSYYKFELMVAFQIKEYLQIIH